MSQMPPNHRHSLRILAAIAIGLLAITGCGPTERGIIQGRAGSPVIVLSEGACETTCPVYDMTIRPSGDYTLNGVMYVKKYGVLEGNLGDEAWDAALAALNDAKFWGLRPDQTSETLATCISGAPIVAITLRDEEGREKTVRYDAGCNVQKLQRLVVDLRSAMSFETLVWTNQTFQPPA